MPTIALGDNVWLQISGKDDANMHLRDTSKSTSLQLVIAMLLRDGAVSRMQLSHAIEIAILELEEACCSPKTLDPRAVYSSILFLGQVKDDVEQARMTEAELLAAVSRGSGRGLS